jgi:uncharacterized membrane protein
MNKKQFLEKLSKELKSISKSEVEQVIDFYSNYIDEAVSDEITEEQVIEKIGNTNQIVNKIKSEFNVRKLDEEPHIFNLLKAIVSIFKRVPLLDSFRVSVSLTFKLIFIAIISLFLLVSGIAVSLFGSATSLILLYSSLVVQDVAPADYSNLVPFIFGTFIFLLVVPVIVCIIIATLYYLLKLGKNIVNNCKNKFEKVLVIFDGCILIPFVLIVYSKIIKSIDILPPSSLIFLEAIAIIAIGLTGVVLSLLMILSKYINRRVAKSFGKILIKLEGEEI